MHDDSLMSDKLSDLRMAGLVQALRFDLSAPDSLVMPGKTFHRSAKRHIFAGQSAHDHLAMILTADRCPNPCPHAVGGSPAGFLVLLSRECLGDHDLASRS